MPKQLRYVFVVVALFALVVVAIPASASNLRQTTETPAETPTEGTPAETPTGEATVAETPTVEVPTATATELPGTELLVNGGFEADADGWTVKNSTGDKVKTNKTDPVKVFAYEGVKAFQFKNGAGENSKLSQAVDLTSFATVGLSDTLTLYYAVWTKNVAGKAGGTVKVKYVTETAGANENGKDKIKVTIAAGTADYALLTSTPLLLVDNVTAIKLQFSNKATAGKWYLDAVSLRAVEAVDATPTTSAETPTVEVTATEGTPAETATVDATATETSAAPLALP